MMSSLAPVQRDFVGFAMEWSNAPWYFRQPGQTGTSNQINRKVVAVCGL
jgi:hypothetical protein